MMRHVLSAVAVMLVVAAVAAPHVDRDEVVMEQNRARQVTITYTLRGDPGIVTVDIQTNTLADASGEWVSIGAANLSGFEGAVNRFVDAVDAQSVITWNPVEHWPDHKLRGGIVRAEVKAWATNNPPDVVVFDLANNGETRFYTSLDALPGGVSADEYKTSKLVMKRCHAAGVPFMRGSPRYEPAHNDGGYHFEDPWIGALSSDFYLGVYELTEGQYQYVAGSVPAAGEAARKPHVTFSWNSCRGNGTGDYNWPSKGHAVDPSSIMGRLRSRVMQDVDLPTAAQWEFACRAGTESAFANGVQDHSSAAANTCGWNSGNSGGAIHEVGTIYSNEWGFSDMHGNASEWVLDYVSNLPQNYDFEMGPSVGPADHKWMTSTARMIRGGGFVQSASLMRSGRVSDWAPPTGNSDHPAQIGCRVCLPTAVFKF